MELPEIKTPQHAQGGASRHAISGDTTLQSLLNDARGVVEDDPSTVRKPARNKGALRPLKRAGDPAGDAASERLRIQRKHNLYLLQVCYERARRRDMWWQSLSPRSQLPLLPFLFPGLAS